jgi:hypothetical protein
MAGYLACGATGESHELTHVVRRPLNARSWNIRRGSIQTTEAPLHSGSRLIVGRTGPVARDSTNHSRSPVGAGCRLD